jgi:hypothetical protein
VIPVPDTITPITITSTPAGIDPIPPMPVPVVIAAALAMLAVITVLSSHRGEWRDYYKDKYSHQREDHQFFFHNFSPGSIKMATFWMLPAS